MSDEQAFDRHAAHRCFSAECFNRAWDLIDKADRTPEENDAMVHLCHASIWHWMQRPDCTERNLSIGYWQASRIYALIGEADRARRYAEKCLHVSQHAGPFYLGYAYEALARCERIAKDLAKSQGYLQKAREMAARIADESERKTLLDDVQSLE